MDIEREFDRLTAPPASASAVRRLSREEIDRLLLAGQITPVEQIPQYHLSGYERELTGLGSNRTGAKYGNWG